MNNPLLERQDYNTYGQDQLERAYNNLNQKDSKLITSDLKTQFLKRMKEENKNKSEERKQIEEIINKLLNDDE